MSAEITYQKCAWPECRNQIEHHPGDRRKQEYCSPACKQKAYRQRLRAGLNRNVTFWEQATTALDHLDTEQLHSLKQMLDARLTPSLAESSPPPASKQPKPSKSEPKPGKPLKQPQKDSELLYYRKDKGVIHLSVNRMASFCGRDLAGMNETEADEGHTCQRCQHIRDTQTWWHGYRQAYGV